MALPTVSIITVNFNDGIGLERTIQSVIGQSYQDWELIIQDGGSNDNSLPIIHQYASHIAQWDSGQDEGIYDAMNKGIKKAKGTWLIFMNAGDEIASPEVLEKVMQQAQKDADFLYGHTEIHYPDSGFTRLQTASPLATFWKRLPFVHQSMLVKSALMREKMYDLSFSLCADFAFAYPCY
ncbi:MAG: glycosyltransferase family 2 protein, partial [Bacteroidota bacterium]